MFNGLPKNAIEMAHFKSGGMTDRAIAQLTGVESSAVQQLRERFDVRPSVFKIDSCSGQFVTELNYLYLTYQKDGGFENESETQGADIPKVIIFGSGPNCISQGIEFDYCSVHAAKAVKEMGFQAIMVNCNPDTVSTDHSVSDKLYFSPLMEEDVAQIIQMERRSGHLLGALIQFGGQTALKCATFLDRLKVPILGTSQEGIDLTEDRNRFRELADKLGINQPCNYVAETQSGLKEAAERLSYPIILRPSYVIGGKGMEVVESSQGLERSEIYNATEAFAPVLVEEFLNGAKEVEVDLLADGKDVCILGIVEHFEKAGIHSGDSYFALPPLSLTEQILSEIREIAYKLAIALQVIGLMNIQFALKGQRLFVLEANLRASRTIPFLSKATQTAIVNLAAKIALGISLRELGVPDVLEVNNSYIKQPIFSLISSKEAFLGPQMKSTGEQMYIGKTFEEAFKKLVMRLKKQDRNCIIVYGESRERAILERMRSYFSRMDISVENGLDLDGVMPYFQQQKVLMVFDLTLREYRLISRGSEELSFPLIIDNVDLIELIAGFTAPEEGVEHRSLQEWKSVCTLY
jgi:carbamoyl-phosphate synthase large subunit